MTREALWEYPCPQCQTTLTIHEEDCDFRGEDRVAVERSYIDIVAPLVDAEAVRKETLPPDQHDTITTDFDWLKAEVEDTAGSTGWSALHTATLRKLKRHQHVVERDDTGNLRYVKREDREYDREPYFGDIELVHEYGACDGCLDVGVCSMVSWCEMQEFTWEETVEFVEEWLDETDTWERGSFEEPTKEALIEDKRHVYEEGHGWATFAATTVSTMKSRGHIPSDQ